jgi:SAM-dependent methyltransferase
MHLSLPTRRAARTPEERAFRQALRRQGYSLPPIRRPGRLWRSWVNRALRTSAEVDGAVAEVEACGLAAHSDRAKNWDLLVTLGTILERTNTRGAVLEMGAAKYSRLLPWLYAYGYRRLVGIDLVPMDLKHPTMIDFRTMDLSATSFPDGSFDAIGCLSVIEHGVSPEGFAREASRLLRPGGVAILSTDFWWTPLDVADKTAYGVPVHVLTPEDIGTWLEVAARHGLTPISPVRLECVDKVVRWERLGLDYTFVDLVLEKRGRSTWLRRPRGIRRDGSTTPRFS